MKKKISLLLCAGLVAAALAGCGGSGNSETSAPSESAQGQAEEIRERARQWLGRTLEGYDGLRQAMDGLFARARSVSDWEEQLRQADERAHSLREELLDHE